MVVGSFKFQTTNGKVKTGFVTVRKYVFGPVGLRLYACFNNKEGGEEVEGEIIKRRNKNRGMNKKEEEILLVLIFH